MDFSAFSGETFDPKVSATDRPITPVIPATLATRLDSRRPLAVCVRAVTVNLAVDCG
jgi:hypothetical protein